MTTRIRHASATYEALVVALAGRLLAHRGLGRALAGDCLRGSVQETWARTAPQRGLLARGQGRAGSQARLLLPRGAGARPPRGARRGQSPRATRYTLFGCVRAGEAAQQEGGIEKPATNGASWYEGGRLPVW